MYNPFDIENPRYVLESVLQIREELTNILQSLGDDSEISQHIRAMRAACRKFMNQVGKARFPQFDLLLAALGEMRAIFGVHIAQLSVKYISSLNISNIRTAFHVPGCQVGTLCVVSPLLFGLVLIYGLVILFVLIRAFRNIKPVKRVAVRYWLSSTGCLTAAGLLRMSANFAECTNHAWGGYVILHLSTGLIIIAYVITLISWLHTVFIKMTGNQTLIAIISAVVIITVLSALQCVGFIIGADMALAIIMAALACLITIAMTVVSGRNYIYFLQNKGSIRKKKELSRRILVPLIVSAVVTVIVILLTGLSFSPMLDLCAGAVMGTILYFVVSIWPLLFITWIYIVYVVQGSVVSGRSTKTSTASTVSANTDKTDKEVEIDELEKKDLPQ